MIRYVRQRDKFRCGPVAIINTMKALGQQVSYQTWIPQLDQICLAKEYGGTFETQLNNVLVSLAKKKKFSVKGWKNNPTLGDLDKELSQKRVVLLRYFHSEPKKGHYTTIIGRTKQFYILANDSEDRPTITKVSRKTMQKYLATRDIRPGIVYEAVYWPIEKI